MNTQTHVRPEPKHIWPFLAWTFGISWGSWLIPGTSQSQISLLFYLSFGILLCFCMAVLYKQTASVFACMVFHGCINFAQTTIVGSATNGGRYLSFQVANLVMTALLVGWWYWKGNRKGVQKDAG